MPEAAYNDLFSAQTVSSRADFASTNFRIAPSTASPDLRKPSSEISFAASTLLPSDSLKSFSLYDANEPKASFKSPIILRSSTQNGRFLQLGNSRIYLSRQLRYRCRESSIRRHVPGIRQFTQTGADTLVCRVNLIQNYDRFCFVLMHGGIGGIDRSQS